VDDGQTGATALGLFVAFGGFVPFAFTRLERAALPLPLGATDAFAEGFAGTLTREGEVDFTIAVFATLVDAFKGLETTFLGMVAGGLIATFDFKLLESGKGCWTIIRLERRGETIIAGAILTPVLWGLDALRNGSITAFLTG
jgi:hypothetical protein